MRLPLIVSVWLWLAVAPGGPCMATGIATWTEAPVDLMRGEADGIAISRKGMLFMAPRLTRLGVGEMPGHPQHVWSMTSDAMGNIYLGTGPTGRIVKITPSGSQTDFFTVEEPLVTSLAMTPTGELLAGASPGGSIYRIGPDGGGTLWSETEERYIWSLAVTGDGSVYAGTGERGAILKINRSGGSSLFFDSDEPHITSLLPLADGRFLAGGSGRGLVYEIDSDGNAIVLFDGDLPQVTALASEAGGAVLAALAAPPAKEAIRPSVRLRLPDGVQVGRTDENVGSLEEREGPLLRGTIEGLPDEDGAVRAELRGRLVRIMPSGEIAELWSSTGEAPFCLWAGRDGEALLGTGEPARLYDVDADGDVALVASMDEAQATGLLRVGRSTFLATSNPAASYRLEQGGAETGVFISRSFDAGGPARWGSIRWRVEGIADRAELYTRTGNSREPDRTWSAWSPALTDPANSRIINPDGRFMQWRARLIGSQAGGTRLSTVSVTFEPYNRPPTVRMFRLEGGGNYISGEAVFDWSASDPDGDAVEMRLRYRSLRSAEWSAAPSVNLPTTGKEHRLVWDTAGIEEGSYEVQPFATDQGANALGEGHEVAVEPPMLLTVDRTPPEIEIRFTGDESIEVILSDRLSEIRRLELRHDENVLFAIRPSDGMCDSRVEIFRLERSLEGGGWSLRGEDAAGNAVEQPLSRPENVG
jgi:hypothetical protein